MLGNEIQSGKLGTKGHKLNLYQPYTVYHTDTFFGRNALSLMKNSNNCSSNSYTFVSGGTVSVYSVLKQHAKDSAGRAIKPPGMYRRGAAADINH